MRPSWLALVTLSVALAVVGRSPARAQTNPPPGSSATVSQAVADGQLNLSDPTVRERLRAAGIDPEDLEKMMLSGSVPPMGGPTGAPAVGTADAFPPVTPAPGAAPAVPDTTHAVATTDSAGTETKYFGYDIFTLKPNGFQPQAFGPVSPDYLLGPGDELIVSVWGGREINLRATINREGFIVLPDLGQVSANGYTLQSFKDNLEKQLSRIYSGINRDGHGKTWVDVSLGKLRSIQVFILGDVVQPGGYTLSATSTLMNALYYAGGPTLKGSLRSIRVVRQNKLVHQSDLYDYLARGTRSQDLSLENGDVVFVPPISRQVRLEGEVRHPAIYELREGEKLSDLLEISGGMTAYAFRSRIQVERVIPYEERRPGQQEDRRVVDLDLTNPANDMQLRDGDIVRVPRNRDILRNTVRIVGPAVYKPGIYEHREGMTVADLVDDAGGLLGEAYTSWAHLVRERKNRSKELRSFDLGAAMRREPESNLVLEERDEVQVFSIWDIRDPEKVTVQGMVRKPGVYDLLSGMSVTDLIVKAGGLQQSAYRVRAEVSRIDPEAISDGKTADLIYVALGDSMNVESEASRFKLKKNDIVFVREIPNWSLQENVYVTGEVRFPGMYSLSSKTERLSSLIERAGGLESTAYLQAASFVRKKDNTGRVAIDFEQALRSKGRKVNKYDMVLAAGDSINIPREPKTVKVTGDVGFPSSVLWEENRDMDYYINQAGGLLATADKDKISVVMANGRVERGGLMSSPRPDAGAEIRVPRKPQEKDSERLKTFASIISVLSGAATTIYLISQSAK